MVWVIAARLAAKGAQAAYANYQDQKTAQARAAEKRIEDEQTALAEARALVDAYPAAGTFEEFEAAVALVRADDERLANLERQREDAIALAEQRERDAADDAEREALMAEERAQLAQQRERKELERKLREAVHVLSDADSDALSRKYAQAVCDQYGLDIHSDLDAQVRRLLAAS